MAIVRHFAINLVRKAQEPARTRSGLRRATKKPTAPKTTSIKLRRKLAGWDTEYLAAILADKIRYPEFGTLLGFDPSSGRATTTGDETARGWSTKNRR